MKEERPDTNTLNLKWSKSETFFKYGPSINSNDHLWSRSVLDCTIGK